MTPLYKLLPPVAASRLSKCEVLADTLRQSAAFAVGRATEIRKLLDFNPDMDAEARAQLNVELKELAATQAEATARHKDAAALFGNLSQFVAHLNANPRKIEIAPDVPTAQRKGETFKACLARLRDEITQCKREQQETAIAPLPREALVAQARQYVDYMANQIVPTPIMFQGSFSLNWAIGGTSAVGGLSPAHIFSMLAWTNPELVTKRLIAVIEQMPAPRIAPLTVEQKSGRLKELGAQLDRLEHQEESIVRLSHEDGMLAVSRRPDASPLAVLGLKYAIKPSLAPVPRRASANGANGVSKHPLEKTERVRLRPKQETKDASRTA